jgi:hypothetical protein
MIVQCDTALTVLSLLSPSSLKFGLYLRDWEWRLSVVRFGKANLKWLRISALTLTEGRAGPGTVLVRIVLSRL